MCTFKNTGEMKKGRPTIPSLNVMALNLSNEKNVESVRVHHDGESEELKAETKSILKKSDKEPEKNESIGPKKVSNENSKVKSKDIGEKMKKPQEIEPNTKKATIEDVRKDIENKLRTKIAQTRPESKIKPAIKERIVDKKKPISEGSKTPRSNAFGIVERPATSRIEKEKQKKQEEKPHAPPKTARAKRPTNVECDIDPISYSQKIRAELEAEFGNPINPQELSMPWLDELEQVESDLLVNFQAHQLTESSIIPSFEKHANSNDPDESPFDSANRMIENGFAALRESHKLDEKILDERMQLMKKMHDMLLNDHIDDFKADLVIDEDPLIEENKKKK